MVSMAISIVQKAGIGAVNTASSGNSGVLPGNVTAGNALIAFALTNNTSAQPTLSTVSNGHDNFTLIAHFAHNFVAVNFLDIWVYIASEAIGGYTSAVTFTFSGTVGSIDVGMLE